MTLLEALRGPRVLVMDAAMGTALLAAGVRSVSAAPLTHPDLVRSIHESHVAAGAEVVLTCTFQYRPSQHWYDELPQRARALADAARPRYVLGDVGPTYDTGHEEVFNAEALRSSVARIATPDGFLLETWSSPAGLDAAHGATVGSSDGPVLLSLAYRRDNRGQLVTHSGHPPEFFAREAPHHDVAALGVNCGRDVGLRDIIEILRRYRNETDLPLFARPNAGTPGPDGAYPLTPQALADAVPEMVAAGARMIGGCCGTTAAHVAAVARALRH